MGSCSSSQSEEAHRSANIDKLLKEQSHAAKREAKILLLGGGESGKSTIVKQMKIIHQNGYSVQELQAFKPTIFKNITESIFTLIAGVYGMNLQWAAAENQAAAERLTKSRKEMEQNASFSPQNLDDMESIWKDGIRQSVMDAQNHEYYIIDSASYFMANIRRISETTYTPTEQDVLRARSKTEGMIDTFFTMGPLRIHMFDVGGQRSERRKWIHCFEAVTSIIFCVALSEYDMTLIEEPTQNRMMESLTLFESVVNSRWFLRTSIILFLNKVDVFKDKLPRIPLSKHFPEYTGGSDVNTAAKFILWRFSQMNRANLNIFPHLTQATDTANIRVVFAAVKLTVMQNALKDTGIL
ncbi:hypothetical protein SmJEL517_g02874 [Synchytrium microbalum]|uniref:Uncharacterized protein n=1 Tax=Synchytrium microbalum TaxID=1806994 RepID=A0A507C5C5_9FUNG|nr:uncharacterized protein SmJEL517_g02874 [Synchytrium microbalum]TPX34578.1 hypothetical protein SmJEL517_g02874 [Synchytrium microbalum]